MKKHYLLFFSIAIIAAKCPPDADKEPDHSNLRILLSDSLEVVDNDEARNVPESIRELSDVIVSEEKKCDQVFVLDPSLVRLDQPKDFSIKTAIEKGGAKNTSNPKVVGKLIGKHLDEVNVPESFIKASGTSFRTASKVYAWLTSQAPNDSILVYSPDGPETYALGKRMYPTFADIEGVREHIRKVLCQNARANFTLLYNPPNDQTAVVVGDPGRDKGGHNNGSDKGKHTGHGGGKGIMTVPNPPQGGICDYTTHTLYERVSDADGRDKRGKVLVMNCKACGYVAGS